jgi:hypothetical protein
MAKKSIRYIVANATASKEIDLTLSNALEGTITI